MLQEDIVSLSEKLMLPITFLQKLPVDQIGSLCHVIMLPPDIFRVDGNDVSIDTLIGKIQSNMWVLDFFELRPLDYLPSWIEL